MGPRPANASSNLCHDPASSTPSSSCVCASSPEATRQQMSRNVYEKVGDRSIAAMITPYARELCREAVQDDSLDSLQLVADCGGGSFSPTSALLAALDADTDEVGGAGDCSSYCDKGEEVRRTEPGRIITHLCGGRQF
ncbi:Uu.00g012670.m01.CDS01 [Anthostomella pinea]|uniref:Uu.00g012670.m01.CDS01 n=1 Tax=Anthostomella pinea TaxID=933095 RepID=A0AAI8VXZ8_9PEZI|nr:Uu.00g012670.m01.CDS01 [Anthostomella pinea]